MEVKTRKTFKMTQGSFSPRIFKILFYLMGVAEYWSYKVDSFLLVF